MVCLESLDKGNDIEINRCAHTDSSGRYTLLIDDLFSLDSDGLYRLFAYKTGFKDSLHNEPIQIPDQFLILPADFRLEYTDMPYHFELSWHVYACLAGPCGHYWETLESYENLGEDSKVLTSSTTKYVTEDGEVIRTEEQEMYVLIEPAIGMVNATLHFSEEPIEGITVQKTYLIEDASGQGFQQSGQILIH